MARWQLGSAAGAPQTGRMEPVDVGLRPIDPPRMRSAPQQLPFSHLNLRFNPFGELTDDERAAVAVADPVQLRGLAARLLSDDAVILLTGEPGRGKTTMLRALHLHLTAELGPLPFVRVATGGSPPIGEGRVVFVDEAQRLGWLSLRRLLRRPGGFALTAPGPFRHLGVGHRLVTVGVGDPSPERLALIVERRIELARRGAGPVPTVDAAAVAWLVARFADDVRAAEQALYEVFQRLEGADRVQMRHFDCV